MIALSCGIKISAARHLVLSECTRVTDRQTDGQNYNSQDRPRICSRGKNISFRFGVVVSALVSIIKVTLYRARLVLGWVTVSEVQFPVSRCRKSVSVYNQSPSSPQPGHLSVGRHNEYQPNGGEALRLPAGE